MAEGGSQICRKGGSVSKHTQKVRRRNSGIQVQVRMNFFGWAEEDFFSNTEEQRAAEITFHGLKKNRKNDLCGIFRPALHTVICMYARRNE